MIKDIDCPSCFKQIKIDLNKTNYNCSHCWYNGRIDENWKGMKKLRYSGKPE